MFFYLTGMLLLVLVVVAAYLLGSIPSSVWLGRWKQGIDLRQHGSGNAGATNAFRVLGKPIGTAVLVMDMLKGFLAVNLSFLQVEILPGTEKWMILRIAMGMMAVTGHIFPLFAGFKGGKGVATLAGVGLAIHPYAALAAIGIYLLVFLIFKLSALGSLTAVLSYPVWVILVFRSEFIAVWIFAFLVPLLVVMTHRSNIKRLIQREEKSLFRKSSGER
jgi:glycerol-3-phosphate acyltransferase PlsY